MFTALPYRLQIPLGLSMAVVLAALLVTGVTAQHSASTARVEIKATADRAASLVSAQAVPLLAADDTWRVYALLRSAGALLPGADHGLARAAVLDSDGRVFAASNPESLQISRPLLGASADGDPTPAPENITGRLWLDSSRGDLTVVDPLRSEDGQLLGFSYIQVDAPVFATDLTELGQPAVIGVALAVALLVPAGWWAGMRMTRPIAQVARVIERLGHVDPEFLKAEVPRTNDRELGRISAAVDQLIDETRVRKAAEQRALAAERMAAVGRLTAVVAHEINNPLGGLLNATRTLAAHGGSEETRLRTVDLIERGLQQIRATVTALLPQARLEERPLEPDDLNDVALLAQPSADRSGVSLDVTADVETALRVPSAVMRQVMLNLLLNAAKAAGDGGSVTARLSATPQYVFFRVTNTGAEMTQASLERSIAAESGNDPRGFGLWVCNEIALQYGGALRVHESAAPGTTLVFEMPNREQHEDIAVD
jgi:two-component system NtrC family sensor kinase